MLSKPTFSSRISKEKTYLIFILALGCLLRLIWPEDMEWKGDERKNYSLAVQAEQTGNWPSVGIPNSQGIANPPLAVWVFSVFAWMSDGPIGLVRWIQWSNVVALLLCYLAFIKIFPESHSTILRGLALFAVSPMPIIYSRKIWQQCVLPLFSVPLLLPFIFPRLVWPYFFAGMFACFGVQLHQAGMFFYPILFGLYGWFYRKEIRRKQSLVFLIGGLTGLVPMIPWFNYITQYGLTYGSFFRGFDVRFAEYLTRDIFALGTNYLLQGEAWRAFLQFPVVGGVMTHGVFWIHIVLLVNAAVSGIITLLGVRGLMLQPKGILFLCGAILLYGLTLFLCRFPFYPHYLILLYPIFHMGAVAVIGKHRWVVHLLIVFSLLVSVSFLAFIHQTGGSSSTEYGQTYRAQGNK